MVGRYLITTADERTWKFDRPVIFLGEWCLLHDRKDIWQAMDYVIAAPYGLGQEQKDADLAEARALECKLFPILCEALNKHHRMQHSSRFWQIVLGHWLRRYVNLILNRVKTLQMCLQAQQLSGVCAISDIRYALAPKDSLEAIWAFNDDRWNNVLYSRILNFLGVTDCPMQIVAGNETEVFTLTATPKEDPPSKKILKWCYRKTSFLISLVAKEDDAFILNSYLPKKEEIKLQLTLGQMPQLRNLNRLKLTHDLDYALRQNLTDQIGRGASDSLFGIMRSLLFDVLPACYLESFAELYEKVQQLPYPEKPKFIFTSNNFDTDEVFKLWAAMKVEAGTKYIVGQHGANYGTHRYYQYRSIEEATADRFLTWGWCDNSPQHTPAFIFKTSGWKTGVYNPVGGLLLIELPLDHRITTWDITHEFAVYFVDQQTFVGKLNKLPKMHLTVRLHGSHPKFKWCEKDRWSEFDPTIRLDDGALAVSKLISQNRLVIHSYDSTGILETLSLNVPMLAFWQNNLDHLRDSSKPYYQLLVDVGIFHLTAESAAKKVNEVWDDVEGWWTQSAIQVARKQFCDRYARASQNPVRELKKILLRDIS